MSEVLKQEFDYLIIGGGSAGCALASRLSESPKNKVLLIEAGRDYAPGEEPPEILDSFAGTAHRDPRFTWSGLTAAFLPRDANRPKPRLRRRYTQGRVIGGTSSVNGMISNRGLPSDYDAWVARGAAGWSWGDVLPFFLKLENDSDFVGPLHSQSGPVGLRRIHAAHWPGFVRGVFGAVERAGWSNIEDQNARFEDGYFPVAICNVDDQRISSARAYLTLEVRARANLHIVGEALAERLCFSGVRVGGALVRMHGELVDVHARETVVCSGALHSPALLLRSGIGDASALRALGISVVADRAGVGSNLMEHPGVNFGAFLKPEARLPPHLRRQMFAGLRWSSGLEGCMPGDMFLIPSNKAGWHAIGARMGLLMVYINQSFSTGEVRLTGAQSGDKLDIDFDMCSDARDLRRLVLGTRLMLRLQADPAMQSTVEEVFPVSYNDRARKVELVSAWNRYQTRAGAWAMDSSPALRSWIIRNFIADGPSIADLLEDDAVIEEWIRSTVLGHWHASGTCRMGRAEDPMAVTDGKAKVIGVDGLRVCDSSIMPTVPCANTNIPSIMIGEKIASHMLAGE